MDDNKEAHLAADCCLEEVGEVVQRLVRVLQLFERDQIKIFGITSSQCYTLLEVSRSEGLAMSELSSKMNLDTSTMTRIIGNLVRDGLVERVRDESDRRFVMVRLTPRGQTFAVELRRSIEEYYGDIVKAIPKGQVEQVLHAAHVLLTAFETANPNCC